MYRGFKYLYRRGAQKLHKKETMKLIIAGIIAVFIGIVLALSAMAADTSLFNWGDLFSNMRGGYAINQHLQRSTVFYTPFKSFHRSDGLELASINVGYDGLQRRPLVAAGLRLDNLDSLLWAGPWGKAHVTTAKLPSFEFGPYISAWPMKTTNGYKIDMYYGFVAAMGFQTTGGK
jgi:hypothetical protein